MAHWRHILHSLLLVVFAAGAATAGTEIPASENASTLIARASEDTLDDASWFFLTSGIIANRPGDAKQQASDDNVICGEPDNIGFTVTAATVQVNREIEGALVDDEALGRVSGGAILFAPPDAARPRLFAIILWDEVKSKRSVSYEQGSGQIISTISVQQLK